MYKVKYSNTSVTKWSILLFLLEKSVCKSENSLAHLLHKSAKSLKMLKLSYTQQP